MASGHTNRVPGDIVVDAADGPIGADLRRDSVPSGSPGAFR